MLCPFLLVLSPTSACSKPFLPSLLQLQLCEPAFPCPINVPPFALSLAPHPDIPICLARKTWIKLNNPLVPLLLMPITTSLLPSHLFHALPSLSASLPGSGSHTCVREQSIPQRMGGHLQKPARHLPTPLHL